MASNWEYGVPYVCGNCGFVAMFKFPKGLFAPREIDIKTVIGLGFAPATCNICGQTFWCKPNMVDSFTMKGGPYGTKS